MRTCYISQICCDVGEIERECDVRESMSRHRHGSEVAGSDLHIRFQVEHDCIHLFKVNGDEARGCVELEIQECWEGEVHGSAGELSGYAAVERAVGSFERGAAVERKAGDSWDRESEH